MSVPVHGYIPRRESWLTIERIQMPMDGDEYRISIAFPNGKQTMAFRHLPDSSEEELRDQIHHAISNMMRSFHQSAMNAVDEIRNRHGGYDNTRDAYRDAVDAAAGTMSMAVDRAMLQNLYHERVEQYLASVQDSLLHNIYSPSIADMILPPDSQKEKETINRKAMLILAQRIGYRKMRAIKKHGYFEEQGKAGLFRFHLNKSGGVTLIQEHHFGNKKRTVEWDLCIQSAVADMPKGDVILSRWLSWKANEDEFLETANFRNIKTVDEAFEVRPRTIAVSTPMGRNSFYERMRSALSPGAILWGITS